MVPRWRKRILLVTLCIYFAQKSRQGAKTCGTVPRLIRHLKRHKDVPDECEECLGQSGDKLPSRSKLRDRIEEAGRRLVELRSRKLASPDGAFDKLVHTHANLHRRIRDIDGKHRPSRYVVTALEADIDGLIQSIYRWIDRQDEKRGRLGY